MNGEQMEMIPGTNRDASLSQWFSPPDLAQRVVEWADPHLSADRLNAPLRPLRVLEPSAGNGALVRPLVAAGAEVTAVELDARYFAELTRNTGTSFCSAEFLAMGPESLLGSCAPFDLCVMNPPYENGMDVQFILHALKFAPRVVGIFTDRILFGVERKEGLWSQVRPTRIAFQSRRPFKGAQTDYVVAELIAIPPAERPGVQEIRNHAQLEWW